MPRLWDRFSQADALTEVGAIEAPHPGSMAELFTSSMDAVRAGAAPTKARILRFATPYVYERGQMLEKATGIPAADWRGDVVDGPWAPDDMIGGPSRRRARMLGHIRAGEISLDPVTGALQASGDEAVSALEGNEEYAKRLIAFDSALKADPSIPSDEKILRLIGEDILGIQRHAAGLSAASPGPAAAAAEFAGQLAGGLVNVAQSEGGIPMLVAGGAAKVGGSTLAVRLAQRAGLEGFLGGATQLPVEVQAFQFNRQVNVPYTMKEAAANVLFATLGSAVLGAGIQGGGEALAGIRARVKDVKGIDEGIAVDLSDLYGQAKAKNPALATPEADAAAATLREVADVAAAAPALDEPQARAHQAIAAKAREDLEAGDLPAVERQSAALRQSLPADKVGNDKDLPFKRRLTEADLEAFDPVGLEVDAKLFQFKTGGDELGVTERLRDVNTFEPAQAGTVLTWEDRAGKLFIVDGHQRMGIARRALAAGQDPQTVFLTGYRLREADGVTPQHARVLAAFKNIGEGTGSAIDVAKIYREAHRDLIQSMPQLSGNNALARDGRNLAKLEGEAFGMAINGVTKPEYAAIVGELIDDAGEQVAAIDVLRRSDPANQGEARAIVEQVRAAGFTKAAQRSQGGLFSDEAFAESLFKERAQVLQGAKAEVRRDLSTFRTLSKQKGRIAQVGNKLAEKQNLAKVAEDEQVLAEIDRLANVAGPVADALKDAARKLNTGELNRGEATAAFVGALRSAADGAGRARPAAGARQSGEARKVLAEISADKSLSPEQKVALGKHYQAALAALPEFKAEMQTLADQVGGRLIMGPLKSAKRSIEKLLTELGGDVSKLKDLVRGTVEVDTVPQIMRLQELLSARADLDGTVRNGYAPDAKLMPTHYRDVKANLTIAGHSTEIQANLPAMIEAKEKLAHPLYEKSRVIDAKAEKTPEDLAQLRELERLQREIYDEAFSTIERNAASSTTVPLRVADDLGNARGAAPSKASAVAPSGARATGTPSTSAKIVPAGKEGSFTATTSGTNDITGRVDLLGDDTQVAQALADAGAAKDTARNAGQVDLETGDPSDLFSVARNQANLFDQPAAARALERAEELVLEEPERMVTLVDDAGAERRVPMAQAFADLDAEEAALRRVALCATPGG